MVNILVVSTPRSGSSALISDINGQGEAIFGELLLPTCPVDLRSNLLVAPNPFEFLQRCGYQPSNTPGIAVEIYNPLDLEPVRRFTGFKIMSYHALKNLSFFFRCVINADKIVILVPASFKRQIISLAKVRAGGDAHYYASEDRPKNEKRVTAGMIFRSFLVVSVNNFLLHVNCIIFKLFFRRKILQGAQKDLSILAKQISGLNSE